MTGLLNANHSVSGKSDTLGEFRSQSPEALCLYAPYTTPGPVPPQPLRLCDIKLSGFRRSPSMFNLTVRYSIQRGRLSVSDGNRWSCLVSVFLFTACAVYVDSPSVFLGTDPTHFVRHTHTHTHTRQTPMRTKCVIFYGINATEHRAAVYLPTRRPSVQSIEPVGKCVCAYARLGALAMSVAARSAISGRVLAFCSPADRHMHRRGCTS